MLISARRLRHASTLLCTRSKARALLSECITTREARSTMCRAGTRRRHAYQGWALRDLDTMQQQRALVKKLVSSHSTSSADKPGQAHTSGQVCSSTRHAAGSARWCRCGVRVRGGVTQRHILRTSSRLGLAASHLGATPHFVPEELGKVIAFYVDTWPGRVPRLLTRDRMGSFIYIRP